MISPVARIIGIVGQGRKVHAHRNGWAMCGAGRITVAREVATGDEHRVCRRCAKHLVQPIVEEMDYFGTLSIRRTPGLVVNASTVGYALRTAMHRAIQAITLTADERAQWDQICANLDRAADEDYGVKRVSVPTFDDDDDFAWYRRPVVCR
jgi:hypothetical protein